MSNLILTYQGAVQSWELDSNDHMNVMFYINKFELAGRNLGHETGMHNDFLKKNNWGVAVVEQNIQYMQEVLEDELIRIESGISRIGNKSFSAIHKMISRDRNEVVSIMKISLVLLDKTARKSVPIPEEFKENMKALLVEAS
ncbi:MAG: thioesterase family protein [Bacteroidia bacterium]|nr:thioesterase family protein [Bacteroidia bacterium]